ncbi:RidA family protein [Rheinheimera salexigens]|uniref:Reactive intermediate/imine deaminase n=1 Tax=Rheinheimera salexigens TaxID=1628148 RepID=A0A1E7Q3E6_9GAMM|nr:RidA family protein [Rheinheimera salexigens]OEY68677.1 reactive intermediate/imine deaminase [Rheinheimera salexigens]
MSKVIINTDAAPAAIGTYSQAVKIRNTVYISGQIPLVPSTMQMVSEDFAEQTHQVFKNLKAVCEAAGGGLNDMVKVNIYMVDLGQFATVNEIMSQYFAEPYPARAAVQISALPKASQIEIDGVMEVPSTY